MHSGTYPISAGLLVPPTPVTPQGRSDAALVAAVRGGRQDDYRFLVERYQGQVFALLARMGFDRDTAEDLAQESFIRAFQALGSFRGDSQFNTWLYRIVYRQALQHLRTRSRHRRIEDQALRPALMTAEPLSTHGRTELREALASALAALPAPQRMALALYYFHERSYQEVAETMDTPLNTVKTHIRRGKLRLRELFEGVEVP